jgi:hypothetical protein
VVEHPADGRVDLAADALLLRLEVDEIHASPRLRRTVHMRRSGRLQTTAAAIDVKP